MSLTIEKKPHNMLWATNPYTANADSKQPRRVPSMTSEEYVALIRRHYRHE